MTDSVSERSVRQARRLGERMMTVLRTVTVGWLGAFAAYKVVALFMADPQRPPPWAFAVPALVAPAALAVYWRPAYRVQNCFFLTGVSAFFLGYLGAGWGSLGAPIIGGGTIIAMFFAPRDGGWRERWGRDEDEDDEFA